MFFLYYVEMIEPKHQENKEKYDVGKGQSCQIVTGTFQIFARSYKNNCLNCIAKHFRDDYETQIIKIQPFKKV